MKGKKEIDLGAMTGDLLLFGGVYSNLHALQELQKITKDRGIPSGNVICTGDVVAYCAFPEECVALIREWGIQVIAGNVELQLASGRADCGCEFRADSRCDLFSRQWYPFAQEVLSDASIDWMKTLPEFIHFDFAGRKSTVVHGSFFETAGYIFQSTEWAEKTKNFEATNSEIIVAGHCGLPFSQSKDNKMWLNPGVIGMPANDGSSRVWYGILGAEDGQVAFSHHSYAYDHRAAAVAMTKLYLPVEYANTLRSGIWDNTEILPDQETKMSGEEITLDQSKKIFSL